MICGTVINSLYLFMYFDRDGVVTIEDVCLRVSEPVASGHVKSLLPQYSCFMVSPANLWFKDSKRSLLFRNLSVIWHSFAGCLLEQDIVTSKS